MAAPDAYPVPRPKLFPLSSPTCQNSVASSARGVSPRLRPRLRRGRKRAWAFGCLGGFLNAHATKQDKAAYSYRQSTSRPYRPHRVSRSPLGLPSLRGISRARISLLPPAVVRWNRPRTEVWPRRDDPLPCLARDGSALHQKDLAPASPPAKSPLECGACETPRRRAGPRSRIHRRCLPGTGLHRSANSPQTYPRYPRRCRRQTAGPRRAMRIRPWIVRRASLPSWHESLRDPAPVMEQIPQGSTGTFGFPRRHRSSSASLAWAGL